MSRTMCSSQLNYIVIKQTWFNTAIFVNSSFFSGLDLEHVHND